MYVRRVIFSSRWVITRAIVMPRTVLGSAFALKRYQLGLAPGRLVACLGISAYVCTMYC